ncbi:MAG: DUF3576 domain-containing protein [Alphaproteobacteria bacterium]
MFRFTVNTSARRLGLTAAGLLLALTAAACGDREVQPIGGFQERQGLRSNTVVAPEGERRLLAKGQNNDRAQVTVNGYVWRAAIDTISFMPINQSDPYGGIITTDWYTPPESPNERLRLTVAVYGPEFRSDSVKVTVFRQNKNKQQQWVDAKVDRSTSNDLENVILARAREIRNQQLAR